MANYRIARLESLFKEEISDIIRNEIKNIDFGLTSITRVVLSGDLRHAKVYVSIFDKENKQRYIIQYLNKQARFMKGIVGRRIRMRHVPDIDFIHDKTMEEADHIFKLMEDIKKESVQKNSAGT